MQEDHQDLLVDLEYLGKSIMINYKNIRLTTFGLMFVGFLAQRVHQESKV